MFERLIGHHGTEVGTADADVDDVLDAFAGMALRLAAPDAVGEISHLVEHGMDRRHDIFPSTTMVAPFGARRATCRTARFSVMLLLLSRSP